MNRSATGPAADGAARIRGIEGELPAGERVLWQGAPDWRSLALRAYHVRGLALYFTALLALRAAFVIHDGGGPAQALVAVLWLAPAALAALGLLALLAWLSARTTIYAITDRRIVMRVGIALPMTVNIPFRIVAAAGFRAHADGTGEVPLALLGPDRLAWLHLWPHVRPWRVARPEPMLRALPEAARIAALLGPALAAHTGGTASPVAAAGRGGALPTFGAAQAAVRGSAEPPVAAGAA